MLLSLTPKSPGSPFNAVQETLTAAAPAGPPTAKEPNPPTEAETACPALPERKNRKKTGISRNFRIRSLHSLRDMVDGASKYCETHLNGCCDKK